MMEKEILRKIKGRKIESLEVCDNIFRIGFRNYTLEAQDVLRCCCEHRYFHTDDELKPFVGTKFTSLEVRDGGGKDKDYGTQDAQFLLVNTSLGTFTIVAYNEHNGYYGGFDLQFRLIMKEKRNG